MNTIPLSQIGSIGGYQDKPYITPPAVLLTRGLDPFRTPGVLESVYLEEEFGTNSISPFSGNILNIIYMNGVDAFVITTDSIYSIDMNTGAYNKLHTVSSCRNAILFNGYIYIALSTRYIMRYNPMTNTLDTTWGDFTLITSYRPMVIQDGVLYIGNKYYVAIVDESADFVENALDIPKELYITSLYGYGYELYIGAESSTEKSEVKMYRWNTWSESFSMDSTLQEDYLFGFFIVDGRMYVCTGSEESAKIFSYAEPTPVLYTTIPLRDSIIRYGPNVFAEWNGRVYIATTFQTTDGNSDGGVWCFGSVMPGANPILVQLYSAPEQSIEGENVAVTCICPSKNRLVYGYKIGASYKLARISTTLTRADFFLNTSFLDLTRGDATIPMLRVHCTSLGNASSMYVNIYTDEYTAPTRQQLRLNIPLRMFESVGRFPENTIYKIELGGYIEGIAIRGIDFLFD